jgi:hypothetical protein
VLLFAVSGAVSETAVEVINQVQTSEPELFDETFKSVETLLPEFTPAPTNTPAPSPTTQVRCGALSLNIEPWLHVNAICEQQPAQSGIDFIGAPAHTRLLLADYPVTPSFHKPQIRIFPVDSYRELNAEAVTRIDQLQDILQSKPARPEEPYPFLPVWNAGQTITVQFEYLEFENGSGIRYLTQYGQAAWPINNEDLFYTFQGLTADGAYYISAVLPVTHPDLPPNGDAYIGEEYEAFIESYTEYLEQVGQDLEDSTSNVFQPSLTALDEMLTTLSVR